MRYFYNDIPHGIAVQVEESWTKCGLNVEKFSAILTRKDEVRLSPYEDDKLKVCKFFRLKGAEIGFSRLFYQREQEKGDKNERTEPAGVTRRRTKVRREVKFVRSKKRNIFVLL